MPEMQAPEERIADKLLSDEYSFMVSEWPSSFIDSELLEERIFRRLIAIERKRTERSKDPFLLMLFELESGQRNAARASLLRRLIPALLTASRDTDMVGWYRTQQTLGVIFTGLAETGISNPREAIQDRFQAFLCGALGEEHVARLNMTSHHYPDDWKIADESSPVNPVLYHDLLERAKSRWAPCLTKRLMDVAGSAAALLVLCPFLLMIALAVKLTSKGPVFFRQQRVGQYGRCFTFLKFRSMVVNNDASAHKAYVEKLIAGQAERHGADENSEGVFKLANDTRITPVGHFLRRTSLDELPQFINVLRGEMSLVGPRPAIPYEIEAYLTWHRRRILEAKPGITGLWQVMGRSRVTFDEMVRLDLQYAASWTPWMDIQILLRTPLAVIKGSGAH